MGNILDFMKGRKTNSQPSILFDDLLERVRPHFRPAIRTSKTTEASTSYLGGSPGLPQSWQWPEKDGRPLSFLASLDLSALAKLRITDWLPEYGHLLFFYDIEEQPWGFDPNDRGSWNVIHVAEDCEERIGKVKPLRKVFLEFERFESVPDWERFESLGIVMNEAETDTFIDGIHYLQNDEEEVHQVLGYPCNVQGDMMELEAQLASNGVNVGDGTGYQSTEGQALADGAKDWRLLFQLSSDDDLGIMWGDCGRLYFWIRGEDARQHDFSNVWLVLQCS